MNIMEYQKASNELTVYLQDDFNLDAVREIEALLGDREILKIDLERARFVNTEAIIFLHRQMQDQKKVHLINPPKLFYEALQILGLHEIWDLTNIVER